MIAFREAMLEAVALSNLTPDEVHIVGEARRAAAKHPRLWKLMEHRVAMKYEADTGNVIGKDFDWSTIIDWLIASMPLILAAIKLLLLFATESPVIFGETLMDTKTMATSPDMQAGTYKSAVWFLLLVAGVDKLYPGAGALLQQAADALPWAKLWEALQLALSEWQAGKDFLTILFDVLTSFGATVNPPVPTPTVP